MTKYQKRSRQQNIPGAVLTRTSPGGPFICPAKVHLQKRQAASGAPARTRPYAKVAFLGGAAQQCPGLSSTTLIGPHRCAQADLVVVPDLSLLHDVDALAAEVDLAVSVFYIVSLGVGITTQTQLADVQGSPRRLDVQHCVRHVSASGLKEVRFCVGPRLAVEAPDVHSALRRIARAPKWNISVSKRCIPVTGEIVLDELQDVASWACSERRVCNEAGPKAFTQYGGAMPA